MDSLTIVEGVWEISRRARKRGQNQDNPKISNKTQMIHSPHNLNGEGTNQRECARDPCERMVFQ